MVAALPRCPGLRRARHPQIRRGERRSGGVTAGGPVAAGDDDLRSKHPQLGVLDLISLRVGDDAVDALGRHRLGHRLQPDLGVVGKLHDQLRAEPAAQHNPSEQAATARSKARGQRAGWRGPLAWDDIDHDPDEPEAPEPPSSLAVWVDVVAVERAMRGERLPLTALERRDAVSRLTHRGLSARCIAELLHTTVRTVTRLRASAREDAA